MKKTIRTAAAATLFVSVCLIGPGTQAAEQGSAEKLYDFAAYLFEKSQYYRAVTEYERFIFLYPGHNLAAQAQLRIGLCYRRGGQTQEALQAFETAAARYPDRPEGHQALFEVGETYYLAGDYPAALEAFQTLTATHPAGRLSAKARYRSGWCLLRMDLAKEAAEAFSRITPKHRPQFGHELAEATLQYRALPLKKPAVAGTLSALLPGAGQLYVHRPIDGAAAFLLNAAFLVSGIDALRHGSAAVGSILLFFEAGWYAGNIFNALNDAHQYNRNIRSDFFEQLLLEHPEEQLSHIPRQKIFFGFVSHF